MSTTSVRESSAARRLSRLSRRFTSVRGLLSLSAIAVLALLLTSPVRLAALSLYRQTMLIPVFASVAPGSVSAGSSATVTVNLSAGSPAGGTVQVSCAQPGELSPPTGIWPYELSFAPNATSASFTVTAPANATSSQVTIPTCQDGLDISNPANWQATASCAVLAQPAPGP